MAWYDTPIRPLDPVIEYDQVTGLIRYFRDTFVNTGQNSFALAPAQPQDIFEVLQNVMPIMRGTIDKRWGYTFAGFLSALAQLSFEYQSDTNVIRRLMWCMQTYPEIQVSNSVNMVEVTVTNEDGSLYLPTLFGANNLPFDPAAVFFPSSQYLPPRVCSSRDFAYLNVPPQAGANVANTCLKWDGSTATGRQSMGLSGISDWGLFIPGTNGFWGPYIASIDTGGQVTLVSGRTYASVGYNSVTGQMSDLPIVTTIQSGVGNQSTGPQTSKKITLQLSPDWGAAYGLGVCDKQIILATADGGDQTLYYQLAVVNSTDTTYVDNTDELTLLAQPVLQETDVYGNNFGVADNAPAPRLTHANGGPMVYPIVHNGRMFLAGQQSLYFSKNLQELTTSTGTICGKWEECWPAAYVMPISTDAEFVTALMSDGQSLYVATNRHIRRISGDGPTGTNPFVLPQITFNDVGVVNQETWQKIYQQGAPVGSMWLTPDLRVIGSDFSSYKDLGTPVQDVLNTINTSVLNVPGACHASFFSNYQYDVYVLAIPTGSSQVPNVLLVYDLRSGQWMTWATSDVPSTMLFNMAANNTTNWYFSSSYLAGPAVMQYPVYRFDPFTYLERNSNNPAVVLNPEPFTTTVRTCWMHFGMPVDRKWLNEIEVSTNDSDLLVTVEGASLMTDFNLTPSTLKSNAPLVVSPLGPLKVFLANTLGSAKHRYYRFTFQSTTTVPRFLGGFNIEALPIDKL